MRDIITTSAWAAIIRITAGASSLQDVDRMMNDTATCWYSDKGNQKDDSRTKALAAVRRKARSFQDIADSAQQSDSAIHR